MATSTFYATQSRNQACHHILQELDKNGIVDVTWNDIAREFEFIKHLYQYKKGGYFHIPDFEVQCVYHRLVYRNGK